MKIYVYLDESGSIHKNSNAKYFAVGGYFVFEHSRNKVISLYRKINKDIKIKRHFTMDKEIKSFDMHDDEKRIILETMQGVDTFRGCTKVFDKTSMRKEIVESNIFFNYSVKVLIKDCILPFLWKYDLSLGVEFILSIDNRNLRVADLNNL